MTIRVCFFASLRERLGAEIVRDIPVGTTVLAIWDAVRGDDAVLREAAVRFAVNEEYVDPGFVPVDGDEVAVFPPVSGGC